MLFWVESISVAIAIKTFFLQFSNEFSIDWQVLLSNELQVFAFPKCERLIHAFRLAALRQETGDGDKMVDELCDESNTADDHAKDEQKPQHDENVLVQHILRDLANECVLVNKCVFHVFCHLQNFTEAKGWKHDFSWLESLTKGSVIVGLSVRLFGPLDPFVSEILEISIQQFVSGNESHDVDDQITQFTDQVGH